MSGELRTIIICVHQRLIRGPQSACTLLSFLHSRSFASFAVLFRASVRLRTADLSYTRQRVETDEYTAPSPPRGRQKLRSSPAPFAGFALRPLRVSLFGLTAKLAKLKTQSSQRRFREITAADIFDSLRNTSALINSTFAFICVIRGSLPGFKSVCGREIWPLHTPYRSRFRLDGSSEWTYSPP